MMRFAYPQYHRAKTRFLTYTIVHAALVDAGHEVVADIDADADAVLFSMCDVTEYRQLMAMRREAGSKPLIVGGAYCYNFWSAILYADAVWVGEVYELAECQSLDEIYASPHCHTGGDELPIASQRIDWERVPLARLAPRTCSYWGGVGCRNHCRFCFTSWTHKHQVNSDARIAAARQAAAKRKLKLTIVSNEYENDPGGAVFDMLLKTYLERPVRRRGATVRCGVEFATDESRKRNGKPVTRDQIYHALQKSKAERISLRLFHITGYDDLDAWERYIDEMGEMLERIGYDMFVQCVFTNLQYQNYTPMYAERRNIDPAKYIDGTKPKEWCDRLRVHTRSVMTGKASPFVQVCCRMGIELARTREQVDYWAAMMVDPRRKLTEQTAYDALMDTGVLDTPPLILDPRDGKISINERWR